MRPHLLSALALALLTCIIGCSSSEEKSDAAPTSSNEATEARPMPAEGQPYKGLVTSGQPSADDLRAAKDRGFKVVINARPADEAGRLENEQQIVEGLGMSYFEIPVPKDPNALTEDQASQLAAIVKDHGTEGVLLHCSGGNRASSLLAIYLVAEGDLSAEEAMSIGKAAGITAWEKAMTQKLTELEAAKAGDGSPTAEPEVTE